MLRKRSIALALFVLGVVVLSTFVMAVRPVKSSPIQYEGYTFPSETLNIRYGSSSKINSILASAGNIPPVKICKGDINLDGKINALDIDPFVALLSKKLTVDLNGMNEKEEILFWVGDINGDGSIDFADINPFVDVLVGKVAPTCISWPIFKLYDFVHEEDIKAYQCRLGPHPEDFPDYFDAEICNREFLEITHDSKLDRPDKQIVGGDSWTNYATHHFFVLENVNKSNLRRFAVGYVSMNKYYSGKENHYIYVKNFVTNEWELLDEALVARNKQGFMGYVSGFGSQANYVNENGEMWFMGTEGAHSGKAIGTDTFAAVLRFSIFGVDSVDEAISPSWMKFVFKNKK